MIADTTFLSDFHDEREAGRRGPASRFLAARRSEKVYVTVISVGEIAGIFDSVEAARQFLGPYRILRLIPEIAFAAAKIDREQIASGGRLGENDNWIAAFCRYYGQPLISRDRGFDRGTTLATFGLLIQRPELKNAGNPQKSKRFCGPFGRGRMGVGCSLGTSPDQLSGSHCSST